MIDPEVVQVQQLCHTRLARFAPRSRAQRGQAAACERGQRHDGRDATACGTAAARLVAHARCGTARAATLGASQARHLVSYLISGRCASASPVSNKPRSLRHSSHRQSSDYRLHCNCNCNC